MAAIVNVCVDPRMNHELIRIQVESRLERMGLPAKRVFITSDIGGNIGTSFTNAAQVLQASREQVVFAAVFHHDDCVADGQKKRLSLATSVDAARRALSALGIACPVVSGTVRSEDSTVTWSDETRKKYATFNFRMPRLSRSRVSGAGLGLSRLPVGEFGRRRTC
jgi:hypothetical protein